MALHRTVDHAEIREWIEKHGAYPAIIAGSGDEDSDAELTLSWQDPDAHALHVTWNEFFGMFEVQHLRFWYEDVQTTGERPQHSFGFEARDAAVDSSEEADVPELPEDIEEVEVNLFPSAPDSRTSDDFS